MSSIGDIAHALPVVSLIKLSFPDIEIGWVVRERCKSLLAGNPDIDRLYTLPDKPGVLGLLKLSSELKADRYDTALDMQGLALSGIVTRLSGAKRRIGLDRNREGNSIFLTDPIVPGKDRSRHALDVLYGFAEALGIAPIRGTVVKQQYLADARSEKADELLSGLSHPIIAFNMGASTPQKKWPRQCWIALGKKVLEKYGSIALLGGASDSEAIRATEEGIAGGERVRNLCGKTDLMELASTLAKCDALVSADTGPLHIAVDVAAPCVAIYGPTNPASVGPYGDRNAILWAHLECSPCNRRPTCSGRFECMRTITPSQVLGALDERLAVSAKAA